MESGDQTFGKWRKRLWPVHGFELKKIVPLLLLKFFISLNYTLLFILKDTVVVTSDHSGAEVIPVLKGWVVLPVAFLAAVIYSKLTNIFKQSTLFYGWISFLLTSVFVYAFFLYPNMDAISPTASADWLLDKLGPNYSHWVAVYRNWAHTLFFTTAELWSTIVIFVLFWGFANQITRVSEAKRTYTLFIAAGDIGNMMTGPLAYYWGRKLINFGFDATLQVLAIHIVIFGLIILGLYRWMNKRVVTDPALCDQEAINQGLKAKTKLGLVQSIKYIVSSKYLLSIAVLVLGCALSINMIEVTWKAQLKLLCPSPAEYHESLSKVVFSIGSISLITVLLFGGNTLRNFGWHFSAQLAPAIIGSSGLIFLLLSLYQQELTPLLTLIGISPLLLVVLFGAIQNVLSKVVKYSFFDSTKEMVFIPLDQEAKTKGKAAIDVVGSRLGKSGSSWIQAGLMAFAGTGSILAITSYLIPIIAAAIICWMFAVRYLGKEFSTSQEKATATP